MSPETTKMIAHLVLACELLDRFMQTYDGPAPQELLDAWSKATFALHLASGLHPDDAAVKRGRRG